MITIILNMNLLKFFVPESLRELLIKFKSKKHSGNKKYNLEDFQIYPKGANLNSSLEKYFDSSLKKNFNLKKKDKIISLGTCFAEEIATLFKTMDKNYRIYEKNSQFYSANWGRIYTLNNLLEILNYSFSKKKIIVEKNHKGYFDPLREQDCGFFLRHEQAVESISKHRNYSKSAFLNSDLIVLTIGQNESWFDIKYKITWGATPPPNIIKKNTKRFIYKCPSILENQKALFKILNKIRKINHKTKIIITLSPVPSHATFLKKNVILQSFINKCNLRYSIEKILNQKKFKNISYFPSFEIALCNNLNTFQFDNRHVRSKVVENILRIFKRTIKLI